MPNHNRRRLTLNYVFSWGDLWIPQVESPWLFHSQTIYEFHKLNPLCYSIPRHVQFKKRLATLYINEKCHFYDISDEKLTWDKLSLRSYLNRFLRNLSLFLHLLQRCHHSGLVVIHVLHLLHLLFLLLNFNSRCKVCYLFTLYTEI